MITIKFKLTSQFSVDCSPLRQRRERERGREGEREREREREREKPETQTTFFFDLMKDHSASLLSYIHSEKMYASLS
jgi:hypothetical protein